MSAKRDYYEVLGISKDTQINEIKAQYRKLALKFHPDRNKSSEAAEHFKEISEAYAVLSDTKKRQLYDQHGHAGVDGRYSTEDIFRGAGFNFDDVGSILKIFLEEEDDRDLAVLEDKEVLTYYMKLLFRWRMCLTEKEWILIYKKM